MPDTLTQLISKVQAQLQDNGTLFTAATLTAAARQALNDINLLVPEHAAVLVTAVADQKEYELSDYDASATGITDVLLDGDNEYDTGLAYDAYVEDDPWFFRLRTPQAAGETLIVHYTRPYTISGLDGALDSTLSDALGNAVLNGTCYYACVSRAAAGIEANNIELGVTANWINLARLWADAFDNSLRVAHHDPVAKGEPESAAWNDPWHEEF